MKLNFLMVKNIENIKNLYEVSYQYVDKQYTFLVSPNNW